MGLLVKKMKILSKKKLRINDYIGKISCKEEPLDIISAFTKKDYLWVEARKQMVEETYWLINS